MKIIEVVQTQVLKTISNGRKCRGHDIANQYMEEKFGFNHK